MIVATVAPLTPARMLRRRPARTAEPAEAPADRTGPAVTDGCGAAARAASLPGPPPDARPGGAARTGGNSAGTASDDAPLQEANTGSASFKDDADGMSRFSRRTALIPIASIFRKSTSKAWSSTF